MRHPKGNDKINYIIDFFMDICDAPFQVYMSSLWPALMEALITYYELDMVQIFTRYVKPPGIYQAKRGAPHSKGDRKRGKPRTWRRYWGSFSNFDPNNSVADLAPHGGEWHDRQITPGVRFLWTMYDIEQRVMYWIMVYEITEQFFYKWMSGVANSRYCREQYRPWVMGVFQTDAHFAGSGPTGVIIEEVVKARNGATMSGSGGSAPGYGSSCTFSCRLSPLHPPESITEDMKVVIWSDAGDYIEGSPFGSPGGESVASGANGNLGSHWTFALMGSHSYSVIDGQATVIGSQNYFDF